MQGIRFNFLIFTKLGLNINLKNLILPSIVLGIRPVAVISQMMRNSLLKVLSIQNLMKVVFEMVKILSNIVRPLIKKLYKPANF